MNRLFKKTLSLMLVFVMTVSLGVSAAAADQTGAAQAEGPLGIVSAMSVELNALVEATKISKTEEIAGNTFYEGVLNGVDVVLVKAGIGKVLAVASGKGGVGKSTVTANLALTLRNMGYRVGILDADIYGPSQPKMFGVEGYLPDAERIDGEDCILPADAMGIKLMSIGFFIKPSDALIWRDAMATNALRQMIHQTKWGGLDFLLVDLPPGTGGVHLAVISELKVTGAVIVSTPQQVAVADVRRGVEMFRADKIEIPVVGIIENMAWFTPKELPENRYYIFGHGGARAFAEQNDVPFLGDIPIVQSVMDGSEEGRPAAGTDPAVESLYRSIAEKVVENMAKTC